MNVVNLTIRTQQAFLVLLFLLSVLTARGQQQALVDFRFKSYGLEKEDDNIIQNSAHLDDFFERLLQLRIAGKNRINIVHIGDSHIQADYITDILRKNFQHDFGNAGRGLVVPYRVAGTNEPPNFRTSGSPLWKSKRLVQVNIPMPVGIGAVTIQTEQPNARFSVRMTDAISDYSFNAVTLFFQKDINSFHFIMKDTSDKEVAFMGPYTEEPFVNYSRVVLPHLTKELTIQTLKSTEQQNQATIFGLNLENGKEGILYHAIGVNGAKYAHYNSALYFARQTQALQPDVFIISLGTNESLDYPYLDRSFPQNIDKLVQTLRQYNPQAKFILVTPADSYRRKIRPNPGIEAVRNQIVAYAAENGLAFWDMFKATGGKNSAAAWRRQGLLRPDGVHFSREGYEYQGNLLYQAIVKSYNNYVPLRNP